MVPSYLPRYRRTSLRVQIWYRPACSTQLEVHYPLSPNPSPPALDRDCGHTQPQLIFNAQQTSMEEHLVWVSPPLGRETAPNCQNLKQPKSKQIQCRYRGTSAKTTLLETTLLGTCDSGGITEPKLFWNQFGKLLVGNGIPNRRHFMKLCVAFKALKAPWMVELRERLFSISAHGRMRGTQRHHRP